MKVNQSGMIVGNIGMFAAGFLVAGAAVTAAAHLWPTMQAPVFLAALLAWTLGGIAVMLRDRGKRDVEPPSLSEGREYTYFSRTNIVLVAMSATLFGFVVAALVAGLAGLILPEARWLVLFTLFAMAVVGAGMLILHGVFGIDVRDK